VVQLIGQTRQLIHTDAQAYVINGEPVSDTQINAAEQVLLDPVRRVMEELLEHATERPPLERIRGLARDVAQMMQPLSEQDIGQSNWRALELLAPEIIREFLSKVPSGDPSFGAMELETPPPFGRLSEE
jgi:hypothetical protein